MFSIPKLAALFTILSPVLALSSTPDLESRSLERRNNNRCKPNFQGKALSIFIVDPDDVANNNIFEWTAANSNGAPITFHAQPARESLRHGEFFIEFSGQPENTHKIKLTADTSRDLLATVTSDQFMLSKTNWGDKSQHFSIDCRICTDDARALGCRIKHPVSGKCVTFGFTTGTLQGQKLRLGSCLASELYYIVPELSPEEAGNIRVENFDI